MRMVLWADLAYGHAAEYGGTVASSNHNCPAARPAETETPTFRWGHPRNKSNLAIVLEALENATTRDLNGNPRFWPHSQDGVERGLSSAPGFASCVGRMNAKHSRQMVPPIALRRDGD